MVNQFKGETYSCDELAPGKYSCESLMNFSNVFKSNTRLGMYSSDLAAQGKIPGSAILKTYSISLNDEKYWVGYAIAIIFG